MNSRRKGKLGELEFAAFLRAHGFEARRGQQFAGGAESPDVVSQALGWLHIEVKRVQQLNLAEACAQARRDAASASVGRSDSGTVKKVWVVAHRRNREPWMITTDSDELYRLMRGALPFFDLRPFGGPRPITMDAEVFFQFLRRSGDRGIRETREKEFTEGNEGNEERTADIADGADGTDEPGARGATRPTTTDFGNGQHGAGAPSSETE